jgi:hypothetical protein
MVQILIYNNKKTIEETHSLRRRRWAIDLEVWKQWKAEGWQEPEASGGLTG